MLKFYHLKSTVFPRNQFSKKDEQKLLLRKRHLGCLGQSIKEQTFALFGDFT